jgi:hypothetical protein
MGLDFRIDSAPRVKINGEESSWSKAYSLIEDAEYTLEPGSVTTIELHAADPLVQSNTRFARPRWAYSGFSRFRERLWAEIRRESWPSNLSMMQGFQPHTATEIFRLRTGMEPALSHLNTASEEAWWNNHAVYFGDLPEASAEPLLELINHSDCDGDLSPEQCGRLAPRLSEIVSRWPEDDYDRASALNLVRMMEICSRNSRKLIFC